MSPRLARAPHWVGLAKPGTDLDVVLTDEVLTLGNAIDADVTVLRGLRSAESPPRLRGFESLRRKAQ
jgi:hypothetical protein